MKIFNFLKQKKGKKINLEDMLVGRHSVLCFLKRNLDMEVSTAEQQEAENKDSKEQEEIINGLKKIDDRLKESYPYDFIPEVELSDTIDHLKDLINKGYKNCIFQFDSRIENYAFHIFDELWNISNKLLEKWGDIEKKKEIEESFKEMEKQWRMMSFMSLSELGFDRLSAEEQYTWWIFSSLHFGGLSKDLSIKSNISNSNQFKLVNFLSIFKEKDIDIVKDKIIEVKDLLKKNQKITEGDGEEIEKMIKKALEENKKIREEFPEKF